MDVKRMHEMIEKLSECAKTQFDKGIDKVDTCEMGKVIDMMKDLSEAMYYRELTKTMQEYDSDEAWKCLNVTLTVVNVFMTITAMLTADLHLKVVEPTAEVMKSHPITI